MYTRVTERRRRAYKSELGTAYIGPGVHRGRLRSRRCGGETGEVGHQDCRQTTAYEEPERLSADARVRTGRTRNSGATEQRVRGGARERVQPVATEWAHSARERREGAGGARLAVGAVRRALATAWRGPLPWRRRAAVRPRGDLTC